MFFIYVCNYAFEYVCIFVCAYVYVFVSLCMCIYVCVCECVYVYICIFVSKLFFCCCYKTPLPRRAIEEFILAFGSKGIKVHQGREA